MTRQPLYVDAIPVACADHGAGDVCVLVHGAGANRGYWRSLADSLGAVRTLRPDLYGHGDTPAWPAERVGRDYGYGDDATMLEHLLADCVAPVHLVGHSSGGAVCLEFARRHPTRVARLVVAEPMLPTRLAGAFPGEFAEIAAAYDRADAAVRGGAAAAAAQILFEYILGDGEWQRLGAGTRAWLTANAERSLVAHSRASLALAVTADRYAGVACPVLVLCGAATRAPFRRICELLAADLPDARLLVIADASHNAPLSHAAAVAAAIGRFLGAADGGGAARR